MIRQKRLARSLLIVAILCGASGSLRSQTILIETLGGERHVGVRVEESADTVIIRSEAGVTVAMPRSSIRLIDYAPGSHDEKGEGFWMFGLTYGTPGKVNLVIGRHFTRSVGLRVSAGTWEDVAGMAFDGVFRLASTGPVDHMVIAGMGTMEIEEGFDEWTYFQGGYNVNIHGFNAFLALSAGWGTFDSPQPTFQIGYVHRFD